MNYLRSRDERQSLFQFVTRIFSYSNGRHGAMETSIVRSTMNRPSPAASSPSTVRLEWQAEVDLSLAPRRKGENPDDHHGGRRGSRRGEKMARSGKGVGGSSNVPVFTASQNNRVKENAWMLLVNGIAKQYCKTLRQSDRAWRMMDPPVTRLLDRARECVSSDSFNDESFSSGAGEVHSTYLLVNSNRFASGLELFLHAVSRLCGYVWKCNNNIWPLLVPLGSRPISLLLMIRIDLTEYH